jgi:class 3 adenylate cyclase
MFAMPLLHERFESLFETDAARWEAVLARDVRADGLFYFGVASTGIYCRPVCAARRPKRANVSFHRSCDAAAEAGFRPCKLCRPREAAQPLLQASLAVRPVAILFVDIKGFSRLAARLLPEETLALLAAFHARLGAVVREEGGVVHKLLGDGFLAVFGDRQSRPRDAERAVATGLALIATIAAWNAERCRAGLPTIAIGVGVHYGMVAFGAAGGERTIIGDTVNVASRLERLTRRLDAAMAVSDETIRAIARPAADAVRARFVPLGVVRLAGCRARRVWAMPDEDEAARSASALWGDVAVAA